MENQVMHLKVEKLEGDTITILHGLAKPPKKVNKVGVTGSITVPSEFWKKRKEDYANLLNKCFLKVDYDKMTIELTVNEEDDEFCKVFTGKLSVHQDFLKFGINDPKKGWSCAELSKFFKMNRYYFRDKADNEQLVLLLNKFNGSIQTEWEKDNNNRGSVTEKKQTILNSNIPDGFYLKVPLFVGQEAREIYIEFNMSVVGTNDVEVYLVSADANEEMLNFRDQVLDEEVAKFEDKIAVFRV